MKKMLKEFKEFAFKGNVIDMAVGVVIGSAFTGIVTSIVNDLFGPLIAKITGSVDLLKSMEELLANTDEGKGVDSLVVKQLASSLEWKYLGSATGTTTIDLSIVSFKELFIKVEIGNNNDTDLWGNVPFYIPKTTLTSVEEPYTLGTYTMATDFCSVACRISDASVSLIRVIVNSGDRVSISRLKVYYR